MAYLLLEPVAPPEPELPVPEDPELPLLALVPVLPPEALVALCTLEGLALPPLIDLRVASNST